MLDIILPLKIDQNNNQTAGINLVFPMYYIFMYLSYIQLILNICLDILDKIFKDANHICLFFITNKSLNVYILNIFMLLI